MTELIDLPFGLWTLVGRVKHKFHSILQVAPMCSHGRAHWRQLVNMIEQSICGDNAALCQIALTTCYSFCCPLFCTLSFHSLSLLITSSSVSAITTKSSSYNSSQGKATLNYLDMASMTITDNSGLNAEPWCLPSFTLKMICNDFFLVVKVNCWTSVSNIIKSIRILRKIKK